MEAIKPKPNNCDIDFICSDMRNCVYYTKKKNKCKYVFMSSCTSKVAQASAMTIKLKEIMGEN